MVMKKLIGYSIKRNLFYQKSARFLPCIVFVFSVSTFCLHSQNGDNLLKVKVRPYPGEDPVMWDGVYAASNGKVYSALIDEDASAHFYEYDPARDSNVLLYDMAEFLGARGKGVRTAAKIHNKPVEDNEGNIYFVPMNNGSGPRNIDFLSWEGGNWIQYRPKTGELVNMGLVDKHVGCYPLTIDRKRNLLFGIGFNGYLYRFDIKNKQTSKLARVSNWDINRDIFCDDQGNVYGSFPTARVWKYDAETERISDLNIRQPYDPTFYPTQLINPMIDRTMDWRSVEWDPAGKVAYGITCGSGNILFRFDPYQEPEGKIISLATMCDPKYWGTNEKNIPYAPLAFAVDSENQKIYFIPSARNYSISEYEETFGSEETHHLIMYDISTDKRIDLGEMVTEDGRRVFGCEGASVAKDGTLYIVGQVEVKNKQEATRYNGDILSALHLIIYKP